MDMNPNGAVAIQSRIYIVSNHPRSFSLPVFIEHDITFVFNKTTFRKGTIKRSESILYAFEEPSML